MEICTSYKYDHYIPKWEGDHKFLTFLQKVSTSILSGIKALYITFYDVMYFDQYSVNIRYVGNKAYAWRTLPQTLPSGPNNNQQKLINEVRIVFWNYWSHSMSSSCEFSTKEIKALFFLAEIPGNFHYWPTYCDWRMPWII